ncbi:hypothetical protein M422DRAFT_240265 [Sphaerobolus stellatus SS14]|nr:hypothetical protein M422DRAFT_240265 [Sphaerobolus stellatus SS14]
MPPIRSTVQQETIDLIDSLSRRQKDLQEFQIPRLRDYKGPLITQQQYAGEIRDDLEIFSKSLKELELLADDQDRERDRREITQRAKEFSEALTHIRKDARIAALTSKRAIDSMAQSAREELLRSSVMNEKKFDEKSGDAVMNASNNVTEALRRTIGLMQAELERSVLSAQMLEQSSANLKSTTTQHDTLSSLVNTSKHLIVALEKSDWLDRLLILGGLCFFILVVAFIFKRRVIDKSIRLVFWWTRFLPDFSGDAELLKAEEGSIIGAGTTAMTVAASALSAATSFLSQGTPITDPSKAVEEAMSTLAPQASVTATLSDVDDAIQTLLDSADIATETSSILEQNNHHEEL